MFNRSNAIDICCDAPSYPIVQACRSIGIVDPEDVRWCRVSNLQNGPSVMELFRPSTWKSMLGKNEPRNANCFCGQGLPRLEKSTFTFSSGRKVEYLIGQCRRCRAIFWEES